MRVKSIVQFGSRKTGVRERCKKYFLAFEGSVTEQKYFERLMRHLQRSARTPILFEVVFTARMKEHIGHSNPTQVLSLVQDLVSEEIIPHKTSYRDLLESFYMAQDPHLIRGRIKSDIQQKAQQELSRMHVDVGDVINLEVALQLFKTIDSFMEENLSIVNDPILIKDLMYAYQEYDGTFVSDLDEVCLIVDRDVKSFTSIQYDAVLDVCRKNRYQLYVTNPCFEFFLILHKTDAKNYSEECFLHNGNGCNTVFMEEILKEYVPGYKKERFDPDPFIVDISNAIQNAGKYENDIDLLKQSLGTNVHFLITEWQGMNGC
jgi:hypothetical protein